MSVRRQILRMGTFTTGQTMRVAEETQLVKFTSQRIIRKQATHNGITNAKQQFNRLRRLQETNNTGQDTQHARFPTTWRERGRRRLRIQAAIARTIIWLEYG